MSLEMEHVSVSIGKREILHDITLNIQEGEFVSLLGRSGCGKTTLLKTIAGFVEQDKGDIRLQGRSITGEKPQKRGTVIVFQDLRLFPHMTVEKNIGFPMELNKISKTERKERVRELLEAVQLPGFETRRIREMSGGQMQRVALARALAASPRILLLDEPFSGLDESLRGEMAALVRRLHQRDRITTVLVTHDKREALSLSDRIALMEGGRIVQFGTPKELYCRPASPVAARYFGEINRIHGQVKNGRFTGGWLCCKADLPDGEWEGIIRPEGEEICPGHEWTVEESIFLGDTTRLRLCRPDGSRILCQTARNGMEDRWETGRKADLVVKTDQIIWLEKDFWKRDEG